jgi:hypothetical protein
VRRIAAIIILLCALTTIATAVSAQPSDLQAITGGEGRVALVIGNGTYENAPRLRNPPNDARLMSTVLRSLGFRLINDRPLIDARKPAIEQAIRAFGNALRGGAVGLFYYSGHGVQINGANYLIPVEANIATETDVKYELVDTGFVLDEMAHAGNRLNILILDACRNNPFGGRGLRAVSSGLATLNAPSGTVISYATQPGAVAADGAGSNSPFTAALAAAIGHPGQGLLDTFNAVGVVVDRETGGQQQPWFSSSPIKGQFYFAGSSAGAAQPGALLASPPPPAPPQRDPVSIEVEYWDSVRNSNQPADFQAYLTRYPSGQFADIAQRRVAALTTPAAPEAQPTAQRIRVGSVAEVYRSLGYVVISVDRGSNLSLNDILTIQTDAGAKRLLVQRFANGQASATPLDGALPGIGQAVFR